jgi:glyoxylase-like metal-dependent hydrolase (beta-lactamase superfamily II)
MNSLEVLVQGFSSREASGVWHVSSNVTLIRDEGTVLLVDLGAPDRQETLLAALASRGLAPRDIAAVVLTHMHVDHVGALALFPQMPLVTSRGVMTGSSFRFCHPSTVHLSPHTFLLRVPGHTPGDLALGFHEDDGTTTVVAGDLFPESLAVDAPTIAEDLQALADSRKQVLAMADRVVTGHGPVLTVKR